MNNKTCTKRWFDVTANVTRKRDRAQHKGRPLLPPSECYWLVNASPPNYRQWVSLNYGPIFCRFWTTVHQIMSVDAGEIVVCNAVFRLSISCSVPEIFAIEVRIRPESRQKACFRPQFLGDDPHILNLVFKIAPISDHVAKFRGDRRRDRADLALKKQESPAIADKRPRRLQKVCSVYVREVGF